MTTNKLYFKKALILLRTYNNVLVHFHPWNGIIRNKDGEEIGAVSTKIIDKLLKTENFEFLGYGEGLLSHEKYYKFNLLINK